MPERDDRMWTGACAHSTWRVLMHSADDGTPPEGDCPAGCHVVLTTVEPAPGT